VVTVVVEHQREKQACQTAVGSHENNSFNNFCVADSGFLLSKSWTTEGETSGPEQPTGSAQGS